MMKKEEFQKSEWIPFIQKSKSLDELQKEYKGNERIRKNLALIVEDVMAQWEIALCNWKDYIIASVQEQEVSLVNTSENMDPSKNSDEQTAQISNSNDGAENSSSQPLTNQSVNIIINNNFNTNFEPPQDQPLYPKLDELEAPPLNDNTPIMTITNNDDQKSDPMDISEDDVVNEHQNTTTNGIEQTHLSNEGTVVVVMNGSSTFATHHDSPTNEMNKEAPVTCSSEHVQTEHVNDNSNSQIPITENNDLPNKENHLSSLLTTVLSNNSLDVPLTFSNIEKDDFVFQMIRGDGNCFYRAFAFSFLKILGEREESFRVKIWNHFLKGVLTIMKNSFKLPSHLNSSLSEIRTRIFDFLVELFRIGEELPKSWNNVSEIIQLMNQPEFSDGMVLLLRYLTASHVFEKNHSLDMYFEFQSLDTGKSISTLIHDYVLKEVMPMGIEAEEIQINSLITVLKHLFNGCQVNFCFQLHIYHVSHSQERLTCLKYPPTHSTQLDAKESCDGAEDRFNTILSLLFRPGHYDSIVYSPSIRQTNDTQCK